MPGRNASPIDHARLRADDASEFAERLHDLRHEIGLHQPYGPAAVKFGVGGLNPAPAGGEKHGGGVDPTDSEAPAPVIDYAASRPAWALEPIDPAFDPGDPPF